jgi:Carboxypeptidase regulatory-like domain/Neocarzinostatin family
MGTACRIVASLVVACAVAIVGTPSGAQSTRALTVTPDTNLVDGDVVALHGTGFTPSSTVFFCQGVEEGTPGQEDCGVPFQSATADATGEFDATYTVRRFITPPSVGAEIDCAQPSANCRFGASDSIFPTADTVAFAPIAFAPQPPRTVTVTPDTDLVDGDVVALGGSGFTPGDTINFCQGVQAGQPGAPCGAPELSAQVDATGEFAASYTVRRFISRNPGVMMDCAAPLANCTLIFFTLGGGFARRVPITFAPQAPVPQISGIVTDPQGAPVPGVDVWAYTPSDTWVGSLQTVTDAQGSYEFAQVEPGVEYRILFRSAAGSGLASEWFDDRPNRQGAAGITLSDAEFVEANAQLDQAGAMSGSVTDANGNPASGVQVLVFCPGDTWVGSYGSSTASDGTYAIGDLRPADCRVVFVPPAGSGLATEWFDDAPTRSLATDVTVSPAQTVVGIDAQLDETGAISGSVTDANGNPVSGVEVWAFDPGDGFFGFDGGYAINLRPANYRVVFRPPTESGLAPEWFDDAANRSLATDITVSPGQTVAGVDAQLANRP